MPSAESYVDVMLGLWKNIGLTNIELLSWAHNLSAMSFQPQTERHFRWIGAGKIRVKMTSAKVW